MEKIDKKGFTLVELIVTIAVVAIVVTVAIPSFSDIIKNNRLTGQANQMIASLHFARSEAASRGLSVRLEPLVAGTNWSEGWHARIDGNGDGDFADTATSDISVRQFNKLAGSNLTSSVSTLTYISTGGAANATFTLKANACTGEYKRVITVLASGLPQLNESDKSCPSG